MADLKQIKVGDTTYNIEPFSEYIKPTVNSEYYPKFIQTRYGKDSSNWYGKDYPMYGFWETGAICKITVDNYSTKVDMAVKDANQNVITDTYATKTAVTQEIKDAIDGLIDGAPGTLNTLKELSAAIGNDKDYAATVTNLITGIDTKVTNETTRAKGAESGLSARITTNSDNIDAHGTRLTGAETNIAANTAEIGKVKTDLSTNYLPLAGGKKMTGNLQMTENSTSILLRSGSEAWYSGIYANSSGDEVLGIVAVNPRTHIMLGTANPLDRPAATALTPAIDIKNGKVGINKRLGTDNTADAGSYELDVNGTIRANGSGLTNLNASNLSSGTVAYARLPVGTGSSQVAQGSHTHLYAGSSSAGGAATSANKVNQSITFNNGGSGASSGTTFDGSTARTVSYNTIGALKYTATSRGNTDSNANYILGKSTTASNSDNYYNSYVYFKGYNFYAYNIYATSDERLKTNIVNSTLNYYDIINKMRFVEYNWKSKESDKNLHHGILAQELMEILPTELRSHFVSDGEYLSVSDNKLVYLALGALQQQLEINKRLEERIAKLEKLLGV